MRLTARVMFLCLLVTTSARAQGLPERLSDAEFWKLITDISEPTGTFPSENFVSNETGYQWVIPDLLRDRQPGGAYLGVGPEQNFTYIAALQPRIAFIVDIRRQAMLQHLIYKTMFELTDNRADFLSLLFSRPRPPGLGPNSSPQALFAAFDSVKPDSVLYESTLGIIKNRLVKTHGFTLSDDDLAGIEHVFAVVYRYGPHLNYSSRINGGTQSGFAPGVPAGGFAGTGGPIRYITITRAPNGVSQRVDTTILNPVKLANGKVDSIPVATVVTIQGGAAANCGTNGACTSVRVDSLNTGGFNFQGTLRTSCSLIAFSGAVVTRDSNAACPAGVNVLSPMTLPSSAMGYRGGVDYSSLMAATDSGGEQRSFLANETNFSRIRDLERRNLLVPVVGNFSGPTALRGVGDYLRRHHATVTAIYTSNVEEYLFRNPSDWQGYYTNVGTMPIDSASTFIRSIRNAAPTRGGYPAFSGGYVTALGSIGELLAAYAAGRIHDYSDLYSLLRH